MLKFILVPVLALLLSGGSYFVESDPTNLFSTEGRDITARLGITDINNEEVRTRGFPIAWMDELGSFDGASESFDSIAGSINTNGFIQNSAIWLAVAGVLYFAYSRLRNLLGNVAILGIGAALAASYFGLIAFV